MTKTKEELRSNRRVKATGPVAVKVVNGSQQDVQAQLRDVSMCGVFIYLQNRVAEGSTLEVVLPVPEGLTESSMTWLRCKCRVVRIEQSGEEYGVAATIEEYEALEGAELPQA
ncbi:MAG: PilZ domain-containing protein [Terriglobales bacterium]